MNKKVNRNDPCPCGSGKKFKQCCMSSEAKSARYTSDGKMKFSVSKEQVSGGDAERYISVLHNISANKNNASQDSRTFTISTSKSIQTTEQNPTKDQESSDSSWTSKYKISTVSGDDLKDQEHKFIPTEINYIDENYCE